MSLLRKVHPFTLLVGIAVAVLIGVAILNVPTVSASPTLQDASNTVTVTGYATQYVDDDELMFTDGTNTVKIEIENGKASQIPLNTPVKLTVQVKEQEGANKFEVNLISVEKAGDGGTAAAPAVDLPVTTVADIQANPVDDKKVVVRGKITQQISDDKYLFTDGTGMIVLDIDDVPASAVPLNQSLDVFGEIEKDDGRVLIDVKGMQPSPTS